MQILIREAKLSDADAIADLTRQLGYNITVTSTSKNLNAILQGDNGTVQVAVHDQKIVGWIHVFLATRLESSFFCEIGGLIVDNEYRRMGIGKQLIERVQSWCIKQNTSILRVRSNVKRKEAHQFYREAGFNEVKQQEVFEKNL